MRHVSSLCLAVALGGCASTPEIRLRYFASKAVTTMTVTQTIDCSADKMRLLVSHTPSAVTVYSADRSRPLSLDTANLRSAWANTELTLEWYDDGRLKSLNHSAAGQGEAIVKAVLSFAAAAIGGGPSTPCDRLTAFNGGKPASIVYEGSIDHSKSATVQTVTLEATAASRSAFAALRQGLPALSFEAGGRAAGTPQVVPAAPADEAAAWLKLAATERTAIELKVGAVPQWRGAVIVPTAETYDIPIPRPKPFGKQTFALVLAESGAITKLTYNAETGVAAATNAATGVATFGTTSDQAAIAAARAEADLIAANERLANCRAKPADCK